MRDAFDDGRPAEDARVPLIPTVPERMAQNGGASVCRGIVGGRERASERGLNSHERKQRRRHLRTLNSDRFTVTGHRCRERREGRQLREGVELPELDVVSFGEVALAKPEGAERTDRVHHHQTLRLSVRQRAQQDRFDDREHRRVDTDAEAQG